MNRLKNEKRTEAPFMSYKPSAMLIIAIILGALIPLFSSGFFYFRA